MKKIILQILKFAVSGVIALAVLSGFALVYDNSPVFTPSDSKPFTVSRYQPGQFWCCMTEGFGWGKIDKYGYNNAYTGNDFDLEKDTGMLILGSSHVLAEEVGEKQNFVYLLNDMLHGDGNTDNDLICYNAGVAGSFLDTVTSVGVNASDYFSSLDYLVFEAQRLDFDDSILADYASGKFGELSPDSGKLKKAVQKIPCARLFYHKAQELMAGGDTAKPAADTGASSCIRIADAMTSNIAEAAKKCGAKAVLLYHPSFLLDENGGLTVKDEPEHIEAFRKACEEKNIIFLDTTEKFLSYYDETYKLPYGFTNSVPASGHLNATGHRLVAECLYDMVNETK